MRFFKSKKVFRVFLKSGNSFDVLADSLVIKFDTSTTELISYDFKGIKGAVPFHICIKQIEAILEF